MGSQEVVLQQAGGTGHPHHPMERRRVMDTHADERAARLGSGCDRIDASAAGANLRRKPICVSFISLWLYQFSGV